MATHPPIYNIIRAAIQAAGHRGIRTATLLADLPEGSTEGHLRTVLTSLHTCGELAVEGRSTTLRGFPLRVRAIRPAPAPPRSPHSVAGAVEAFRKRINKGTGNELRIIQAVGRLGFASASQVCALTDIPMASAGDLLRMGALQRGIFRRSETTTPSGKSCWLYSLAPAGQRIFDDHATQDMAAR